MRRNCENTNDLAQATHKEVVELKTYVHSKLEAVSLQVQRATFQTVMGGSDVSEFFPVESNDQLDLFMDRMHPEWESRKKEFYNLLFSVATDDKKAFGRGLIKALFARQYICKVKWPSFG